MVESSDLILWFEVAFVDWVNSGECDRIGISAIFSPVKTEIHTAKIFRT